MLILFVFWCVCIALFIDVCKQTRVYCDFMSVTFSMFLDKNRFFIKQIFEFKLKQKSKNLIINCTNEKN